MSAAEEKSQEEQGARQPAPIGRWKTDLIDLIARAPTRRESIR
jgi:hypothetical protein